VMIPLPEPSSSRPPIRAHERGVPAVCLQPAPPPRFFILDPSKTLPAHFQTSAPPSRTAPVRSAHLLRRS
jgi:hypothetical protein